MKLSKITIASALLLSLASGYTLATDTTPTTTTATTPAAPTADDQAALQAEFDKLFDERYPKPADFDKKKNEATNQSNFELMFKLGQLSTYSDELLAGLIEENKGVIEQQNDFLKYLDNRAYVMENRIDDNEENIIKLDKKADDLFAGLVYAEQGYEELRNDINNNQDDLEQLKDDMDGMKNTSVKMVEAIVKKAAPVLKNGVDSNKEAIEKNKADIATNKETISENTAKIVALQTSSTANVEKLEKQVNSNTSDIKNVDDRVTKLDKDVKKGLATQAALNGLFQPYTVGKANISAAVGGYKSNTAIAVGTGYRFNENVAAKAGISVSTGGKAVSYNVGVNYEF